MADPTPYPRILYKDAEASLPKPATGDLAKPSLEKRGTLVVLDDDPTGTQTVHDITVLTTFEKDILIDQFKTKEAGFFILTNTRAYHHNEAKQLLTTLLENVQSAARETDTEIEIVLRSDSTLRGHFPLENDLTTSLFGPFDAWILAPSFFEGGRVTMNDVHYALDAHDGVTLVPVGDTPSAADKGFGFKSSNLKQWIAEKYEWQHVPDVISISVEELREGEAAEKIAARLRALKRSEDGKPPIIVPNTFAPSDMEMFVATVGLAPEVRLLYRTGASFVSTRLGIAKIPPVSPEKLFGPVKPEMDSAPGGLTVIGSYIPRTTAQREYLLQHCNSHIVHLEIDVAQLLGQNDSNQDHWDLVNWTARTVDQVLEKGMDAVVSTSRKLITNDDGKESLFLGSIVTSVLVNIVKAISVRPKYVIAKGGITSSDIATEGLGMKKARVVGQAATGVPLWRSEPIGRPKWPYVPYIVFPGNVGTAQTLGDLVASYRNR